MRLYLLITIFCISSVIGNDKEAEADVRKKILQQLTKTRTVILDDYSLVTRQSGTDVYMYQSYRTVSVIFYPIMRDVAEARFMFQAEELHLNRLGSCEPVEVIVNIKRGSYPAVNPDGYDFPKYFIDPKRREQIHTINLLSDGSNKTYSILNPKPGNWYALAYIKWEDPRTQKVEQQGLAPDCQTILYTDLQVKRNEFPELIDCYSDLYLNLTVLPKSYRCMTTDDLQELSLNLIVNTTLPDDTKLLVRIQALSFPTAEDYIIKCQFDPKDSKVRTLSFLPTQSSWHYVVIDALLGNTSYVADCDSYNSVIDTDGIDNYTLYDLMRDDKGSFFTFDYSLPTTDLQDTTSVVNISSNEIKVLRFKINRFHDTGGTLTIEASFMVNLKYYAGYKKNFVNGTLIEFSEREPFVKAVFCAGIERAYIPIESGHCKFNDVIEPALFILNSTDGDSIYDKIIIPFPDSGVWLVTVRLFCDNVVCPCKSFDNSTKYYVNTDALKSDDLNEEIEIQNDTRLGNTKCNMSVLFSISSTSCINGMCLNHGVCMYNTFGGLVMSFCACPSGYGAWDCSDDSRMDPSMLVAVLLLTLSNLLFFFSIYVALIRLYFTEAAMYIFTMLLSTFYHACDAHMNVSYCIFRKNILQFGDFYCGIMSFWVTLLAMSAIKNGTRSFLQLTGAIIIALLTTWNMQSLLAFALPVVFGVLIVLYSWFSDYKKNRQMKFGTTYYKIYLPCGICFVVVGLVCYAFLQTEQNYKVVHSIWHMIIALSIVCLLPDNKRGPDANPFLTNSEYSFRLLLRKWRT